MIFGSRTNLPKTVYAPAGEKEVNTYILETDKNGNTFLTVDGTEDIYAKTQADLEDSKIENIIARVQYGDISALSARQGIYGDIAEMPKSWAEAQTKMMAMEQIFNKLPLEMRESYGFNYKAFIADYGSEKFMKAIGITKPEPDAAAPEQEKGETKE
ncbi:minor capsid protein [Capybara microvirus Cap1_SP_121]|nr:minor capsid protein [Capybara microvirus Cap1_SP_121]